MPVSLARAGQLQRVGRAWQANLPAIISVLNDVECRGEVDEGVEVGESPWPLAHEQGIAARDEQTVNLLPCAPGFRCSPKHRMATSSAAWLSMKHAPAEQG